MVAVVVALPAGAVLAPLARDRTTGPDGTVGVVTLEAPITAQTAEPDTQRPGQSRRLAVRRTTP